MSDKFPTVLPWPVLPNLNLRWLVTCSWLEEDILLAGLKLSVVVVIDDCCRPIAFRQFGRQIFYHVFEFNQRVLGHSLAFPVWLDRQLQDTRFIFAIRQSLPRKHMISLNVPSLLVQKRI